MGKLILKWLISATSFYLTAWLLPGIEIKDFVTTLWVSIVFGLVNAVIKPILSVLSFPAIILSLGLFLLVINALMLLITDWIVPGMTVNGFWAAFWGAIVLSLISWLLEAIFKPRKQEKD